MPLAVLVGLLGGGGLGFVSALYFGLLLPSSGSYDVGFPYLGALLGAVLGTAILLAVALRHPRAGTATAPSRGDS